MNVPLAIIFAGAIQAGELSFPASAAAKVDQAIAKCAVGEFDWQPVSKTVVELQPGLLATIEQTRCVEHELKRAGVRYTYQDNRKR